MSQAGMVVPDFLGGLVLVQQYGAANGNNSIVKLDGITGQPYPSFLPNPATDSLGDAAVHTDGTIFAVQTGQQATSVVGINPTAGTQTFGISLLGSAPDFAYFTVLTNLMIAGDGYAYLAYSYIDGSAYPFVAHLMLFRVDSSGNSTNLDILDLPAYQNNALMTFQANLITNAATGTLISWADTYVPIPDARPRAASRPPMGGPHFRRADLNPPRPLGFGPTYGMAITAGTGVSIITSPSVSGQVTNIAPMLQREDGSFVGTVGVGSQDNPQYNMAAFDQTGNLLWTVSNDQPQIATADGGVIGQSGTTYDQNGNATGQVALYTQSSRGLEYSGGGSVISISMPPTPPDPGSFWAQAGGNPSGNGTAFPGCECLAPQGSPGTPGIAPIKRDEVSRPAQAGAQSTAFVILEGDPGVNTADCPMNSNHCHDVMGAFVYAGDTLATWLQGQGYGGAVEARVSSVQNFSTQLTTNGTITGGVIYFGHGGNTNFENPALWLGGLFPGQGAGPNTNIGAYNVNLLSGASLSSRATVTLRTCHGSYGGQYSIASVLARQLQTIVYAWPVTMIFSTNPNATSGTYIPQQEPLYLVPYGGAPVECYNALGRKCQSFNPPPWAQ